jgi:hypothetical protein
MKRSWNSFLTPALVRRYGAAKASTMVRLLYQHATCYENSLRPDLIARRRRYWRNQTQHASERSAKFIDKHQPTHEPKHP